MALSELQDVKRRVESRNPAWAFGPGSMLMAELGDGLRVELSESAYGPFRVNIQDQSAAASAFFSDSSGSPEEYHFLKQWYEEAKAASYKRLSDEYSVREEAARKKFFG